MSSTDWLKDGTTRFWTGIHQSIFRATNGRVLGDVFGMPVVMLTTTGRKSGKKRTTMLTSPIQDGNQIVVVASYGGDDRHPNWYRNLSANPEVQVVGFGKDQRMRARTASPEERADLWPRVVKQYRGYGRYQERTDREIPLVILEPAE